MKQGSDGTPEWLKSYDCALGCIASYKGDGLLTTKEGKEVNCLFEAGQLSNGKVLLLCKFLGQGFLMPFIDTELVRFSGTTQEGASLVIEESAWQIDGWLELGGLGGGRAVYRVGSLSVTYSSSETPQEMRYGLTNFDFCGTVPMMERGVLVLPVPVEFDNGAIGALQIVPCDDHHKKAKRIKILKTVDVTCEVFGAQCTIATKDDWDVVIDDLCYLLSVARGTKIQWVYRDTYGAEGNLLQREHLSRITKSYSPLTVIDDRVEGRDETAFFTASGMKKFKELRDVLKLKEGVVNSYLDAKLEHDYLQVRGAKIAVAIEMLKAAFFAIPGFFAEEYVVPPESLNDEIVDEIRSAALLALGKHGFDQREAKEIMSRSKIRGLNRRAFSHVLNKILRYINLEIEGRELKLFVASRNALVHQGRFYCEVADPDQRRALPPLSSLVDEWKFLINFLDRIFLKLFGYSGIYLDRRVPPDEARVKLE